MIEKFPFYRELSDIERKTLESDVRVLSVNRGEFLSCDGESNIGLFFVLSGCVSMSILSEEEREITLSLVEKGETCVLSSTCISSKYPVCFRVKAETNTRLLILPAYTLVRLLRGNSGVGNCVYRLLAIRSTESVGVLQQVLFHSVEKRVASFLQKEAVKRKSDVLLITHEQLARFTGSAREVITRTLGSFEERGILRLERGKIILTDREQLATLL